MKERPMMASKEPSIFRPPGEANSFLLRVTQGCSHNQCTFCSMYRQVRFRVRSWTEVEKEIIQTALHHPFLRRVFLADGNALVLGTAKLLNIINTLHRHFPKLSRVTCYAAPGDILKKSPQELDALKQAGLRMIYMGIESGDDGVLAAVNKGITSDGIITAGQKVLQAGMKLSTMVILGLGGREKSRVHAANTAQVISLINPTMLNFLTLTLYDGTPLKEEASKGNFQPLTPLETLFELKEILEQVSLVRPCILRSDHLSNPLPLAGILPKDQKNLLQDVASLLPTLQIRSPFL
ncbi:radical SAM protein [Desulforamulus ruminis]|nr:radical SAM protein [Desulforamulus ruminis]